MNKILIIVLCVFSILAIGYFYIENEKKQAKREVIEQIEKGANKVSDKLKDIFNSDTSNAGDSLREGEF